MSNKFSNIKERILYLLEIKGIKKAKFFEDIGVTYGNFTGKAKETPLNSTTLSNIFSKYPDVNLEWLLTGNGEMLKNDTGNIKARLLKPINSFESDNILNETIHIQNITIKDLIAEKNELKKKVHQLEQELKEMQ